MYALILIILCIGIYSSLGFSLIKKRTTIFACLYIIYIWIYDWMFINLSYDVSPIIVNILKLGNELLVFLAFLTILISKKKQSIAKSSDRTIWIFIIFPMLYAILISLVNHVGIESIFQGIRLFFSPIIYAFIFYKAGLFKDTSVSQLKVVFVFILIASLLYSIWQDITYNGELSTVWFYDYFIKAKDLDKVEFDFVRNGLLRTTSVFVSPIISSMFFASTALFLFYIEQKSNLLKIIYLFLGAWGVYLSRTRIGLIYIFLFFILWIIINRVNFKYTILSIGVAIIITLISLIYGITDDLSALGRILQYQQFINIFRIFGYGFEDEYLIKFDSYYISLFIYIGIFAIFILYGIIKLSKGIFLESKGFNNRQIRFFLIFSSINSLCMVYEYAFQYIAGNYIYKLTFLFLFIGLSYKESAKQKII